MIIVRQSGVAVSLSLSGRRKPCDSVVQTTPFYLQSLNYDKMKTILFALLLFISCQEKTPNESIASAPVEKAHVGNHKFIFIELDVAEPVLNYTPEKYIPVGNMQPLKEDEKASLSYNRKKYYSDITEVQDLTEDQQYLLMDTFEKAVIEPAQSKYNAAVRFNVKNPQTREMLLQAVNTASAEKRDCHAFDTYKEASEALRRLRN